jgi:hypothetical protein
MIAVGLDRTGPARHDSNMFRERQLARIAFGVVLLAGAIWLIATARARANDYGDGRSCADVLAAVWSGAVLAALVTRVIASWLPARPTSARLASASLTIPAAGVTLLLPISLHCLWFSCSDGLAGFDDWVWFCILLTGPAHLTFLLLTVMRARQLALGREPVAVATIYVWCVIMGSLPLPLLPSAVIAITGIPIAPLLWLMKPLARAELAGEPLPRAQLRRG